MKKMISACMALFLAAAGTDSLYIKTEAASEPVRILFTHDLNDHMNPYKTLDEENSPVELGGYAYLASAIADYRTGQSVVLDAGNFSCGSMFASLNSSKAADLNLMEQMGYDAVAVGLNDFTYGIGRFAEMLKTAENTPALVSANMAFNAGSTASSLKEGWNAVQGSEYTLLQAGDYTVGVFGLMQQDEKYSGEEAPLTIGDPLEAASAAVSALKQEGADLIVCLYSTDENDFGELCNTAGIDVLILGGSHQAESNYLKQGSTVIVSSDSYGASMGVLDIDPESKSVKNYENVTVSPSLYTADENIASQISSYTSEINSSVMARFSLNQSPVFKAPYSLTTYSRIESGKGFAEAADLITDAMTEAYDAPESDEAKPVSIITESMVTGTLVQGNVSADDLFRMAYKGMGSDGIPGYNLVHVYMHGSDLLALCEADLMLHDENSPDRFHFGRLYYEYSMNRPETNRVIDVYTEEADGYYIAATDDRLYPVITTAEILEDIETMIEKCGADLKCGVYDETGKPVSDYEVRIMRSPEGAAYKVWSAISAYASHFERGMDGVDLLPDNYKTARKQRVKTSSLNLIKLFKHANRATFDFYISRIAVPIGILAALYLLVWILNFKKRKETDA